MKKLVKEPLAPRPIPVSGVRGGRRVRRIAGRRTRVEAPHPIRLDPTEDPLRKGHDELVLMRPFVDRFVSSVHSETYSGG